MRTIGIVWALGVAIAAAAWPWTPPVQAATKAEQVRAAAKIVEETLRREATEGVEDRWELLKPAISQAPRYEAAYWPSGFVYDSIRRKWLRWDELQQLAAKDNRLATYRQMREKALKTVDGQLGLARWCSKRKLEDQARAHLTRVLEIDPNQAEARQHLGFRLINGAWVDERDIAEAQTFVRKASAAAAKWVPRLEKLRDRLAGGNASQREKARAELMAIRDPEAVEAIDTVFCRQTGEMALLGIELLKNIPSPQAAAVLARHAAYSRWPQVREAATTALQFQDKHDYVPLLLDAAQAALSIPPPMQVAGGAGRPDGNSNNANAPYSPYNPGGNSGNPPVRTLYRLDHNVNTYSYNTIEQLKDHPYWWQVPQMRFNRNSPNPVAKRTTSDSVSPTGDRATVQQKEYYTVKGGRLQDRRTENKVTVDKQTPVPMGPAVDVRALRAAAYQQQTDAARSRYTSDLAAAKAAPGNALAEATGAKGPSSPSEWWDWWYDDNEVYVPSSNSSTTPNRSDSKTSADGGSSAQRGDCLAAGTLVCAETGPTAVEKIVVGDRVFCCDPETGCLALKPVLRKTARPEGRLLKIRAGGEEFEASGGHVFWVAGQGWVKARELRAGMRLHTLRGTVPVERVEPGVLQMSFSLVAADFHTFFAGKGMVLTHDNTIRPPTDRVVPGLAAKAVPPVER